MQITLNLEEDMLEALLNLSDARNRSAAVNEAIAEYVRRHKLDQLKGLSGQIEIDENWEKLRGLELNEA